MKNAKISRRSFLLGLAACSAAGILTACKGDDTPASSASTSPEAPASSVSELEPIGLFTMEAPSPKSCAKCGTKVCWNLIKTALF